MRKTAFLAAVAATLCMVACNKEIPGQGIDVNSTSEEIEMGQLTVSLVGSGGPDTKVIQSSDDINLSKVKSLQLFVFDGDVLDVYKSVTNQTSVTMSCRQGTKSIFAIVNAPAINNIKTLSQLKAMTSKLSDNTEQFVMVGSQDGVRVPADKPVELEVKRIVARVALKKITLAFTNSAYPGSDARLGKIYLTNVPTDINYGLTSEPTQWINKMRFMSGDEPVELVADTNDYSLVTSDYPNFFYSYPNPTVTDAEGGTWSARHTRLVVEALIGGSTYYYPITLPVLEAGKSYEIENLTITRLGSNDPDKPVKLSDVTFEISVKPWTVVPVTEGITI